MSKSEQQYCTESDPDESDSDNSQQDPTFDYLQETRLSFSNLSIKKKPRISKEDDDNMEVDENVDEVVVPELNEIDQKSYETVEKLIKVGQVEKLKVDQCKVYLRKHGLRLTGNKDVLIPRIKEHLEIINGGGERKYPASSFVFNCKGDACTGDIVMFEQNVYEMFNIASRAATGPPCGTRIVAGRIVKESYGAAKQQHTFTIEVLWSRGEKPFPPLHPLLIKGRNLYRLKTYRQRWEDEGQRCKILMEKHARGDAARSNRDVRIHDKEMRKTSKSNRALKTKENRSEMAHHVPCTTSEKVIIRDVHYQQENIFKDRYVPPVENNMPNNVMMNTQIPTHPRQPLINMSTGPTQVPFMMPYASSNRLLDRVGSNAYPLVQRPGGYHGNANNERGKKQICRFYPQGRCYFGDNCKYLHDDHSTR